jgi:hypothetical protein
MDGALEFGIRSVGVGMPLPCDGETALPSLLARWMNSLPRCEAVGNAGTLAAQACHRTGQQRTTDHARGITRRTTDLRQERARHNRTRSRGQSVGKVRAHFACY